MYMNIYEEMYRKSGNISLILPWDIPWIWKCIMNPTEDVSWIWGCTRDLYLYHKFTINKWWSPNNIHSFPSIILLEKRKSFQRIIGVEYVRLGRS